MAWLFVRLKLRLIAGSLRGDQMRQGGFIMSLIGAVLVGLIGFLLLLQLRFLPADVALDVGVICFTIFAFFWAFAPLLAFGLDETLDPARLALFPLTTRQFAVGMFAASATGAWPFASLVILLGAVGGLSRSLADALIGIVAVILEFAFCVVASRAVTTALSGLLRSRRGKDLLAVAAVVVVLLFQVPNLIANHGLTGDDPGATLHAVGEIMRWTPPGMAAHAIGDGGLVGLAEVAAVAVAVLLVGLLWILALRRALVMSDGSTPAVAVRRSRVRPRGVLGAIVAKELKYARREPRGRVTWFSAIAFGGGMMFLMQGSSWSGPGVVLAPVGLVVLMISLMSSNAFGIDGSSLWMNAVVFSSAGDLRRDLAGRHIAVSLIAMPVLTAVAVVAAVISGDPWAALPAVLTAWGILWIGMGVGAVISVRVPYSYPNRFSAFTAAAPGQGGAAFAASFAAMICTNVLCLPLVVPVLLGVTWLSGVVALYGLVLAWGGTYLASVIGYPRFPEILASVSRSTSG